jgi:hypothetical protein
MSRPAKLGPPTPRRSGRTRRSPGSGGVAVKVLRVDWDLSGVLKRQPPVGVQHRYCPVGHGRGGVACCGLRVGPVESIAQFPCLGQHHMPAQELLDLV